MGANYLLNGLNVTGSGVNNSVAALDLGGASAQITYHPRGEPILADFFPVDVGGERSGSEAKFGLYTHSHLYWGIDEARLMQKANLMATGMDDPCIPSGHPDLQGGAAGQRGDGEAAAPTEKETTEAKWEACLESAVALFREMDEKVRCTAPAKRCSWGGVYLPTIVGQTFLAMSSYLYTYRFLGLEATADLATLRARAAIICSKDWADFRAYGATVNEQERFLTEDCFQAAYTYALLHHGFGLPEVQTPLVVVSEIGNTTASWAVGKILLEANAASWDFGFVNTVSGLNGGREGGSGRDAGDVDASRNGGAD